MIKKFVGKLKDIFGRKKNPAVEEPKVNKYSRTTKKNLNGSPRGNKRKVNTHKKKFDRKETPEEYIARRAKLAEESRINKSADSPKTKPQKPAAKKESSKPKIEYWDASSFRVKEEEGKVRFHDLPLRDEIMRAVQKSGFEYCTQVQAETLPKSLIGNDITAQAQTGTGKTAAFLITIFNHILNNPINTKRKYGTPRALILAPTRELVLQIEKDARGLGEFVPCSILALLGGIDYRKQQFGLKQNEIDILICTPGRLIDFMNKRFVDLSKVEILVIDEADRMLDMGFIPDVRKIVLSTPQKSERQTMFFSATMTNDVNNLSKSWTRQADEITVEPEEITQKNVEQITYITTTEKKLTLLYNIIEKNNLEKVLIFTNRRDQSRKLKESLESFGISCALLTGEVEQTQRIKRLERFRGGKVRALVATDVASRGIHIEGISHVINFNMPEDPEDYVHRIGRTGRAGAKGISINFADEEDGYALNTLEEFLSKKIECAFPDDELLKPIPKSEIKPIKRENVKRYDQKNKFRNPRKKSSGPVRNNKKKS